MTNKEHWIWLIKTQLKEIEEHSEPEKIALEFADIISISARAIQDLGFDQEHILLERFKNIESRIPQIIKKYEELWNKYKDKIKV